MVEVGVDDVAAFEASMEGVALCRLGRVVEEEVVVVEGVVSLSIASAFSV